MEKEKLQEIWRSYRSDKEKPITSDMIEQQLHPRIMSMHKMFAWNMIFYLVFTLVSIIMLSMNLPGYRNNPTMLTVETGLLVLSVAALGYGIFLFMSIREQQNYSKNLTEMIRERLHFLRTHFELWQVVIALMVPVLSFAINSYVDNMDGRYPIHNPALFIVINLFIFALIYGVNKLAFTLQARELKAHLADLDQHTLEHSVAVEQKKKTFRIWLVFGFILLTAAFVLGTILFLQGR